jgi:hypothetical protein
VGAGLFARRGEGPRPEVLYRSKDKAQALPQTWSAVLTGRIPQVGHRAANHKLYVAAILDFFCPAAPIAEITAAHVEEYRQRAATQKRRVWIGGPDPRQRLDRNDNRWWRTTKRIRSARTTNNYLMCLAALFMIAYNTRNPITRELPARC